MLQVIYVVPPLFKTFGSAAGSTDLQWTRSRESPEWAKCPPSIIHKNVRTYPKKQQDTKTNKDWWITRTQVFHVIYYIRKKKII